MVYLFLAQGFEEIEAIASLDILRKAGLKVVTVGVGSKTVSGNVKIPVAADILDSELDFSTISSIVIPGGYGGAKRLMKSEIVLKAVKYCYEQGGVVGAICAGPSILAKAGILSGKNVTCYPGLEDWLGDTSKINITGDPVTCDGNIVTANGPGAALKFAFTLAEKILKDKEKVDNLKEQMCYIDG